MHLIPAIDLIDGKCVRLTQGDYARKKVYNEDPLEVAKAFEAAGVERLHVVDLDGARSGHIVNQAVLERLATHTDLHIDFGGGLKRSEDLRIAFESGARQITGGTIAVRDRTTFLGWLEQYGPERIILGADVIDGYIAVHGWQEQSSLELFDFLADYTAAGIRYCICTDVAKDGLLAGSAHALYRRILDRFPTLRLIASGGVTDLSETNRLKELGCFGVIVGKAIYEKRIPMDALGRHMRNNQGKRPTG